MKQETKRRNQIQRESESERDLPCQRTTIRVEESKPDIHKPETLPDIRVRANRRIRDRDTVPAPQTQCLKTREIKTS